MQKCTPDARRLVTARALTRLLTTREVAELLAVSPETVLRKIRAGEVAAIRLSSNALRIREEDLAAFLDLRHEEPVPGD